MVKLLSFILGMGLLFFAVFFVATKEGKVVTGGESVIVTTTKPQEEIAKEVPEVIPETTTVIEKQIIEDTPITPSTPIMETEEVLKEIIVAPEPEPEPDVVEEEKVKGFVDTFSARETIEETGESNRYLHTSWWVNSGAYFYIGGGLGQTIQGRLLSDDLWKGRYESKGERTDNGYRPQNIFRLITNDMYGDVIVDTIFNITKDDTTNSIERAASNGVLLFGRYQDQHNLYYAGIRVDGDLMVKKKQNGTYTTMGLKNVFPGNYDNVERVSLIPKNQWMRLRAVYKNRNNGDVEISVSIDTNNDGKFETTMVVVDDGTIDGEPYRNEAFAGIRTDFMDVQFDMYAITPIDL